MLTDWILIASAFLVGSIPTAYLIGRAKGIDIRQHGSKNVGATNVGRVLGRRWGFICFGLDVAKGLVPTLAAGVFLGVAGEIRMPPEDAATWVAVMAATVLGHMFTPWLSFKGGKGVATGLGALLGVFPALTIPAIVVFAVWVLVLWRWRMIGLASVVAAALLPFATVGSLEAASAFFFRSATRQTDATAAQEADSDEASIAKAANPDAAPAASPARPVSTPLGWFQVPRRRLASFIFIGVATSLAALVILKHRANIRRIRAGTEPKVKRCVCWSVLG